MICAHCRRKIRRPAAKVGRLGFGPVCARKLGLLAPASVRYAAFDVRRAVHDDMTMDMFEGVAA